MKKLMVAVMVLGAVLVPSAAFAQTDDAPADRAQPAQQTDQAQTDQTDQTRPTDQVRDGERDVDLDRVKKHALEAIAKRVEALTSAIARVSENPHLEPEHARVLVEDYEFHIAGLERLIEPIEAAETAEELRPLVESIVVDHWVFALQIPKGMLTVASDSITDATEHFNSVYERIENVLAELAEKGIELPEAEELLAESKRLTGNAAELVAPIPDIVLAITVEEMPEARETLEAARADVRAAHDNLVDARENVHQIVRIIKDALGSDVVSDQARDTATDEARDAA